MTGSGNEDRPTRKKGGCPLCPPNVLKYKNVICENEYCKVLVNIQPNSKAHSILITKNHHKDARGVSSKE